MTFSIFPVGSRVQVISYSPFRGLRGTIRRVHTIPPLEGEEPFCYYAIELDGASIQEPIWFEYDEVEGAASLEEIGARRSE